MRKYRLGVIPVAGRPLRGLVASIKRSSGRILSQQIGGAVDAFSTSVEHVLVDHGRGKVRVTEQLGRAADTVCDTSSGVAARWAFNSGI
jgi:hypothetical protein